MAWYQEPETVGTVHREHYLAQFMDFLLAEEARFARGEREAQDVKETSAERLLFRQRLGYPLTQTRPAQPPAVRQQFVAEDDLGRIYRVWIETFPGLETYGLYFQPHGSGPFPLVISQHGGMGTPELCSGLHNSSNYNNMSRRVHARGIAVLAPQLLRWGEAYGPPYDYAAINRRLRAMGGTITALELWQLQRSLDAFLERPEVDPEKVGMVGLSYGGYYTQFMTALDPRIRVALNSCFLIGALPNFERDISWFTPDPSFGFTGWMELIAPRAFYMETGETDDIIPAVFAPPLVDQARQVYARLGVPEQYAYKNHPGWHEFDLAEDGIDFLVKHLESRD